MCAWVMAFLGAIDGALLLRFANKDDTLVLGNPAIFPPPSAPLRVSTAQLAYHAMAWLQLQIKAREHRMSHARWSEAKPRWCSVRELTGQFISSIFGSVVMCI